MVFGSAVDGNIKGLMVPETSIATWNSSEDEITRTNVSAVLPQSSSAIHSDIDARQAKLVNALRTAFESLASYSPLAKSSLLLRSHETTLLFVEQGALVPLKRHVIEGARPLAVVPIGNGLPEDAAILIDGLDEAVDRKLAVLLIQNAIELFEAKEREESLMDEIAANWESLDALCDISTDIFTAPTIKACIQRVVERLSHLREGFRGALFLQESEQLGQILTNQGELNLIATDRLGPLSQVITSRKTAVLNALPHRFFGDSQDVCWSEARCLAAVPMLARESTRGLVVVWSELADKQIDTSFQHLIDALSNRISVLLEYDALTQSVRNTELLEQELEIASTIQSTLLFGEVPIDFPGVDFAALSIPSRSIGGDFYDFYQQGDGSMDVLVGDVMGKGVAAALLGTAVKNEFIRAVASQAGTVGVECLCPEDIVQRVSKKLNKHLIEVERFVTLCYARLNVAKRQLTYVDCGHTSTIVHRRRIQFSHTLQGQSLPLGIDLQDTPRQETFACQPGDTFLFYSDGATENVSPAGELFGMERLIECVEQWSSCGPDVLLEQLRRQLMQHSGTSHFADDLTVLAVRMRLDQSTPKQVVSRQFQRDLGELEAFREWLYGVASLVGNDGLPDDDVTRLLLVSVEAFDNCVIHDVADSVSAPIHFEAAIFHDFLCLTLRHAGPEFDPFHAAPPSFDGSRFNGFGLYIMLRSADEFAYRREPLGINRLTFSILRRNEQIHCHADHN